MWLSFFFPRKTHHNSILSRKMPKHRLTSAFHLFSCHKIRFLRNVLYFRRWTHKHEQSWFRSGWSLSDLNFSNPGQELRNKQTNREKTLKKKKKKKPLKSKAQMGKIFCLGSHSFRARFRFWISRLLAVIPPLFCMLYSFVKWLIPWACLYTDMF